MLLSARVSKSEKGELLAEQSINFMCRTDIAAMNREYITYSTPQREVYENFPDEIKNDATQYPSAEVLANCEVYTDLGEYTKIYNNLWTEITVS